MLGNHLKALDINKAETFEAQQRKVVCLHHHRLHKVTPWYTWQQSFDGNSNHLLLCHQHPQPLVLKQIKSEEYFTY